MTFSNLKMQSVWLALMIIQQFSLGNVSIEPQLRECETNNVNVWLNSSLNCIQIGKLEMKLSTAIMLSWPPSFIILFNGVLPY